VQSAGELNALYQDIYKNLHDRKLMRIEAKEADLKLREKEIEFLETSSRRLSRLLKIPAAEILHAQAPNRLPSLRCYCRFSGESELWPIMKKRVRPRFERSMDNPTLHRTATALRAFAAMS
jgi:hypothetical protein